MTVVYRIAEIEDTIDFEMVNGQLIITSEITTLKLDDEEKTELINAIIDKTIAFIESLN